MKVPSYKQEFWYSCFATCTKMILEYYGMKKSEHDLRILLKTTPVYGTLWEIGDIQKVGCTEMADIQIYRRTDKGYFVVPKKEHSYIRDIRILTSQLN